MLKEMLDRANSGQTLWLPDVEAAFRGVESGTPLVLRLMSFDGCTREYRHTLPQWQNADERSLVRNYLCAEIYNALSVCGGYEMELFTDTGNAQIMALLSDIPELFQLSSEKRSGLGKVIQIADRMGRMFGKGAFVFRFSDLSDDRAAQWKTEERGAPIRETLRALQSDAQCLNCVGIEVGGTDVKLAASANGRLVAVKEYDWNPAAYATAEEIIEPILLLVRLMRACFAADGDARLERALRKDATIAEMAAAVAAVEAKTDTNVLDAVGVSFPDIVLHDRIVGGETPKTDGLRRNAALDYEAEFAKLGALRQTLLALCRGEGRCRIVNDGSMAALTTAVELACGGEEASVEQGVIAHSLGTDLGTGWLNERGEVPQIPLELYDASAAIHPRHIRRRTCAARATKTPAFRARAAISASRRRSVWRGSESRRCWMGLLRKPTACCASGCSPMICASPASNT